MKSNIFFNCCLFIQPATPFWPENGTKKLKIKVDGCLTPPLKVDFTRQENSLLLHLNDSVGTYFDGGITGFRGGGVLRNLVILLLCCFLFNVVGRHHCGCESVGALGHNPILRVSGRFSPLSYHQPYQRSNSLFQPKVRK